MWWQHVAFDTWLATEETTQIFFSFNYIKIAHVENGYRIRELSTKKTHCSWKGGK